MELLQHSKIMGRWSLPKGLPKTVHEKHGSKDGDDNERSIDVKVLWAALKMLALSYSGDKVQSIICLSITPPRES